MSGSRCERNAAAFPLAEIIDRARSGDREAQERLLAWSEPQLHAFVVRTLSPERFRSEGEDVLQTIRMELIKAMHSLRTLTPGAFRGWLGKLVRCRVIDWQRAKRKARRIPTRAQVSLQRTDVPEPRADSASPSRILMGREQRAQLARAIERVPERYRAVLRLIHAREPTLEELAAFLGKQTDAARKFVGRALAHLKIALGSARAHRTSAGAFSIGTDVRLRN